MRTMNNIKFIYFDIGDTLVAESNSKLVMRALNIREEIFRKAFSAARKDMQEGILTPLDFLKSLNKELDMSFKEAVNKWNKALESLLIIEPMHELASDLRKKYKIGLITNIFKGHFELWYNKGKIPHMSYDAIVKSCDEGVAKPEKEIFEIANQKAQVSPKEIFFIDNEKEYVDAAISYGWKGFVFDPKNPVESANKLRSILL